LKGAYSEAVPPQSHHNAPFIDEVWQIVSVNRGKNSKTNPNFIHQAGIYTKDGNFTKNPFYSPSIASYCSNKDKSCYFGSWGQQAHVPTIHKSDILYFNKYRDCGDGVMELISVIHNAANSSGDSIDYLNVPWGGVRTSSLADIVLSYRNGFTFIGRKKI